MEKKKITLSIAIAVRNEEKNLSACLSAVADIADEIIVVDGQSTDSTVTIARKFTDKVINAENESMFHINKQKALDACKGVWILQLDADEIVTKELKEEIISVVGLRPVPSSLFLDPSFDNNFSQEPRTKNQEPINGYYIPRRNYFWGHFMKKGGQYPDFVIRLVRNGKARFPCKSVHEQIDIQGKVEYLTNPLLHYSYATRQDYWKKADAYTTLTAQELKRNNVPVTCASWFEYVVRKPLVTFFSLFFRHKGFIDGWFGLVFAYWSALHFPIAYNKYKKLV